MQQPYPPGPSLAVIIGAGGMAMAIARRLGQRHRLLLTDIDGNRLNEQVGRLDEEGYDITGLRCDVTDAASVATLAEAAADRGGWSVLAHVTGLSPSHGDPRRILSVNLGGAAIVAQALLPVANPRAAAIFIASVAAHTATPRQDLLPLIDDPLRPGWVGAMMEAMGDGASPETSYHLSKWGLLRLCRREAATWGRRHVRVVSISPGLIASPMGVRESRRMPAREALKAGIPLGREGSMIEVADAVEFLASDRARFITGTDLLIDGGMIAANEATIARGPAA